MEVICYSRHYGIQVYTLFKSIPCLYNLCLAFDNSTGAKLQTDLE